MLSFFPFQFSMVTCIDQHPREGVSDLFTPAMVAQKLRAVAPCLQWLALRPKNRSMECALWISLGLWIFHTKFVNKMFCATIGIEENELSQEFWKTIFIIPRKDFARHNRERVSFKSSLPKTVRKDFIPKGPPDIESSEYSCEPLPHRCKTARDYH